MHHHTRAAAVAAGVQPRGKRRAFTLVEMLVVMAVIVLVIGIATPVMNSLQGAGDVNKAVYDITGTLDQARAYAMANGTYVYVGFFESDAAGSESATPQTGGVGRLNVAVVAARDGTRGYDPSTPSDWVSKYNSGANLVTIGKTQRFKNLHLVDLGTPPDPPKGMARPAINADATLAKQNNLANTEANSLTPFEYPLGKSYPGGGTYSFNKVIQFDPQGVARIQLASNGDSIVQRMEIGLQQTHGSAAPALSTDNTGAIAAIQLDPMTGSTHIYRP